MAAFGVEPFKGIAIVVPALQKKRRGFLSTGLD
jgi:hypothetical protein